MKMGPSYKIYIYIYINHNWLKLTSIISLSCLTSERRVRENSNIPRRVSPTVKQNSNGNRSKSKQGRREGEEREKKFHKRRKRRKKARVASVDQAEAAWHA